MVTPQKVRQIALFWRLFISIIVFCLIGMLITHLCGWMVLFGCVVLSVPIGVMLIALSIS